MVDPVTKSIVVNADIQDIWNIWDDFENFPHFMKNILSVRRLDERSSHWAMRGPFGKRLEWNVVTTIRKPFQQIAWESTEGDIHTTGSVLFRTLGAGRTEVTASMTHQPPHRPIGRWFARHAEDPGKRLEEDLENFKRFAESLAMAGLA
jgi:uncharacterized membrane protein